MANTQMERCPKPKAAMACARWLALCLKIGWTKAALDTLEQVWWKYHDDDGNLMRTPAAPETAPDSNRDVPCEHCSQLIYFGLADEKAHNQDGTYHACDETTEEILERTAALPAPDWKHVYQDIDGCQWVKRRTAEAKIERLQEAAGILIDYCEAHEWGMMPEPFDSINPLLKLLGRASPPVAQGEAPQLVKIDREMHRRREFKAELARREREVGAHPSQDAPSAEQWWESDPVWSNWPDHVMPEMVKQLKQLICLFAESYCAQALRQKVSSSAIGTESE